MQIGFAYEMQVEAERMAKPFEDQIHGVKCWFSAARLFDVPAERVFVTINPGGATANDRRDREHPFEVPDYNAWLDEDWSGHRSRGPEHQRRVRMVFESLYGRDGENVLRATPCFPVAPFRTPSLKDLPKLAWKSALDWFARVIEHLEPRVIICNGNSEGLWSPWGVLDDRYSITKIKKTRLAGTFSLKEGIVASGSLGGARILAFPHLTGAIRSTDRLYEELEKRAPIYRS